jgi:RNA polymerase sigma-70 factor (ECF subfamily)
MWKGKATLKKGDQGVIEPDARLMLQFQKGDERSFDLLFHKYFKYVLNVSKRFFEQESLAEEMAQEVFTQIYLAKESYEATAAFKTWLYRITMNKCLNEKRKGVYQYPTHSIDTLIEDEEGGTYSRELRDQAQISPLENLEKAELEKLFQKALADLTEPQRVSYILSRDGNLSYAEIAQTMKTTENAVKSLIHRANLSLKNYLKASFEDEGN